MDGRPPLPRDRQRRRDVDDRASNSFLDQSVMDPGKPVKPVKGTFISQQVCSRAWKRMNERASECANKHASMHASRQMARHFLGVFGSRRSGRDHVRAHFSSIFSSLERIHPNCDIRDSTNLF